jgi:hypothetical protein
MNNNANHTFLIRQEALRLGFDYCQVARAEYLSEDARRLEAWLTRLDQCNIWKIISICVLTHLACSSAVIITLMLIIFHQ